MGLFCAADPSDSDFFNSLLCFNREEFCEKVKVHRKTIEEVVPMSSGGLLDGRVAPRPAREPSFGPPRGASAGFWWPGGRAQFYQKRQKRRDGPGQGSDNRECSDAPRAIAGPRRTGASDATGCRRRVPASSSGRPARDVALGGVVHPKSV